MSAKLLLEDLNTFGRALFVAGFCTFALLVCIPTAIVLDLTKRSGGR